MTRALVRDHRGGGKDGTNPAARPARVSSADGQFSFILFNVSVPLGTELGGR